MQILGLEGYTRFVGKYVTGRRKRFRPHKVYIFLIKITSRVDIAMSVCPSVRMNAYSDDKQEQLAGLRRTPQGRSMGTSLSDMPRMKKDNRAWMSSFKRRASHNVAPLR